MRKAEAAVSFFDYRPLHAALAAEIDAALARVIASGQLILGPEVRAFEAEFAEYVGVGEAVGVASGTDALILALRALGIGPGDEVITVANAGVPPVAAIRAAGALPRFVDVDPDTLLMDPSGLEDALTPRTRCVLPVHLFGQPAPMEPILTFAGEHGLRVIEDCAQAHGARRSGRHVGNFGDLGCFSFYPTKNLGAYGDGGMVVTNDAALAETVRSLRMYGFDSSRNSQREGLNSRLDEIQAAILRTKLAALDEALAARLEIATRYREALDTSPCHPLSVLPDTEHAWHLFVARVTDRSRWVEHFDRAGIQTGIHYPVPVHCMPAYAFLGVDAGALPHTESACASILSLPIYPGLRDDEIERILDAVRSIPA